MARLMRTLLPAAVLGSAAAAPGSLRATSSGGAADSSAASTSGAFSPQPWPQGSSQAFVFLFEWSWDDVALECEQFLGPKGFTAVQISPPNEHIVGDTWDVRYKPVSYNLTSRSGNETQFASMLKRCRAAGVGVYADAVFNQQAPYSGVGVAGSTFGYRTYPLYSPEDFHHLPNNLGMNCGVDNYASTQNVWDCDLSGMPDLCTGCPHVQKTVAAYINRMADLGVTGFRVDAAKHMNPEDLKGVIDLANSSLYHFQEVTAVPGEAIQSPMYFGNGPVTEFGFAATLAPKFMNTGELRGDLEAFGEGWGLMPSDKAVVFLDNHDSQRNGQAPLTYKNGDLYTLANVFMLAYPYGYPRVMSSYYFDYADTAAGPPAAPVHGPDGKVNCGEGPSGQGWVCEHRRPAIANMVKWRREAGESPVTHFFSTGDALAFCRGAAACMAINRGSTDLSGEMPIGMAAGEYCNVIVSDDPAECPRVVVSADGMIKEGHVPAMGAIAIHTGAQAK